MFYIKKNIFLSVCIYINLYYLIRPVIKVLVAFAAGALLGDALVHLIPIGMG